MANPVSTIKPHIVAISAPDALRSLPGWLVWRYEPNGESKPRKVPYYTSGMKRHGVQGSVDDRANMTTFEAARSFAARKGFDGVGLALMPEFNLVALDFDNCLVNSQLHPQVEAIASATYAEYSPSGQGVRCFFVGNLGNKKDPHSEPFGLETFSTKGFVTFTGNTLGITDLIGNTNVVAEVNADVTTLYAQRFGRKPETEISVSANHDPVGLTPGQITECLDVLPNDLSYDDWLTTGMALHHETGGAREGFDVWDEWSQSSPKYTNRDYNWERWVSFGQHSGKLVTARSLVRMANENGARVMLNGPASMDEFDDINLAPQVTDPSGFADISGDSTTVVEKPQRFPSFQAGQFADDKPTQWLIKGVLPKAELVVLFGASGSGKSFAVLDMVAAVSRGVPWRGHRTKQGRVVYVCAEGAGGFKKRLAAYAARQGISLNDIDLHVIPSTPNLLLKADALDICKSIGKADIVVIDTLAQTTPGGDENSGKDMGQALAHCKGIHRATGATVILVHHAGKDNAKGARGWSGLRAAADAEFEVLRLAAGRVLRTSKQKDGDDGAMWGFDLDIVELGIDEDGDPVTSCVIKETEVNLAGATSAKPLGPIGIVVDAVIREMAEFQTAGIEVKEVLKEATKRLDAPTEGKRDIRRQRARQALEGLCDGESAPYYWDKSDDTLSVN